MKGGCKVLIGVLILAIVALFALSSYIGISIAHGITHFSQRDEIVENSYKYLAGLNFDVENFKYSYNYKKLSIPSSKHYHQVPVDNFITVNPEGTAVLLHGLGGDKSTTYPTAQIF